MGVVISLVSSVESYYTHGVAPRIQSLASTLVSDLYFG